MATRARRLAAPARNAGRTGRAASRNARGRAFARPRSLLFDYYGLAAAPAADGFAVARHAVVAVCPDPVSAATAVDLVPLAVAGRDPVVAGTAGGAVSPAADTDPVVAATTVDAVRPTTAAQTIAAAAALQAVVALSADQTVTARTAEQTVRTAVAGQTVAAGLTRQPVARRTSRYAVGTGTRPHRIAAPATGNPVAERAADDDVARGRTDERVEAPPAVARHRHQAGGPRVGVRRAVVCLELERPGRAETATRVRVGPAARRRVIGNRSIRRGGQPRLPQRIVVGIRARQRHPRRLPVRHHHRHIGAGRRHGRTRSRVSEDVQAEVAVRPGEVPLIPERELLHAPEVVASLVDELAGFRQALRPEGEHAHAARVIRAVRDVLGRVGRKLVHRQVAESDREPLIARLLDRERANVPQLAGPVLVQVRIA